MQMTGGCDNSSAGLGGVSGTINSGSAALTLSANNGFKNGCGIFIVGAGAASTLTTPSQGAAPNANVIGTAGSTTVHYKVAAFDANYGTSAASAAITITTAPSTRTPIDYVGIYWTSVANAAGYLVYTDQNGGGTYVPLGYSFDCFSYNAGNTCGIIDKGAEAFSWTNVSYALWPTTPPGSVTNQALITTIASGGGTLSLTLANTAANSVSASFSFPDNSSFIKAAIAAAATDGSPSTTSKGTVFIPEGVWFTDTIPFPSSGISGVNIVLGGSLTIFGLPVEGLFSGGSFTETGLVSITGTGGAYNQGNWTFSGSQINGYPSLGALFVVCGPGSGLNLSHLFLSSNQAGIIQDSQGAVTTQDVTFSNWVGSGPMLQVDNNVFFSLFDRTNWNDSANNTNNLIPAIWFLGLTNTGHTSVFDFRNNSFISHTIRLDIPFPTGGGPTGDFIFDGTTDIEDNNDIGFFNSASGGAPQSATFDNILNGDVLAPAQFLLYDYHPTLGVNPGLEINVHGQTGFAQLAGSASNAGTAVNCRAWTFENPGAGGVGANSIGYYGGVNGSYTGCDLGITETGYDVQTTEVLTSGGNDANGPAGEQIIGHVFRRPQAVVSGTGSGSLAAATYYFKVTVVDAAGARIRAQPGNFADRRGVQLHQPFRRHGDLFSGQLQRLLQHQSRHGRELLQLDGRDEWDLHVYADDHDGPDGQIAGSHRQRDALLAHRRK